MVIGKATEIVYDETSHKPKSVTVRKSTGEEIEIDCNIVLIAAGPWSTRVAESLTGGQAKPVQISAHHANSVSLVPFGPMSCSHRSNMMVDSHHHTQASHTSCSLLLYQSQSKFS